MVKRNVKFPGLREKNVRDAAQSGAQSMAYLCPMRLDARGPSCTSAGLKNHRIVDLCRLALEASPGGGTWQNISKRGNTQWISNT